MAKKITLPTSLLLAGCILQRPVTGQSLPLIEIDETELNINGLQIIETIETANKTTTKVIFVSKERHKVSNEFKRLSWIMKALHFPKKQLMNLPILMEDVLKLRL